MISLAGLPVQNSRHRRRRKCHTLGNPHPLSSDHHVLFFLSWHPITLLSKLSEAQGMQLARFATELFCRNAYWIDFAEHVGLPPFVDVSD
jgi:hypothetical protein